MKVKQGDDGLRFNFAVGHIEPAVYFRVWANFRFRNKPLFTRAKYVMYIPLAMASWL